MKCAECEREYTAQKMPLPCSQDWDGKTWLCQPCMSTVASRSRRVSPDALGGEGLGDG